jgi:uncharacterized protein YciI
MGLFMHPPRGDFIATMTGAERSAFDAHAAWLRKLLADGVLIVSGPCLGQVNTGIAIFEASNEQTARGLVAEEPVTSGGYMRGDRGRTGWACCAAVTGSRGRQGWTGCVAFTRVPSTGTR